VLYLANSALLFSPCDSRKLTMLFLENCLLNSILHPIFKDLVWLNFWRELRAVYLGFVAVFVLEKSEEYEKNFSPHIFFPSRFKQAIFRKLFLTSSTHFFSLA